MKKIFFFLLGFALLLPFFALSAPNLKGYVKSNNGTPLANVVVTDGYTTTQTNASGYYELTRNANARLVYLSTPAGYTAPIENSIPQFYAKIYNKNVVQWNDFTLIPTGVSENKHVFVIMADPQPQTEREVLRFQNETIEDLKTLKTSLGTTPLHVGTSGDNCWDASMIWPYYKRSCARAGVPFYNSPGNHDHDFCYSDSLGVLYKSIRHYEKFFGPSYYSYNRGDVHYIVLDDIYYWGGKNKTYESKATLSQRQKDWLVKDLSYVPKTKLIVVNLHIATKRRSSSTPPLTDYANVYKIFSGYSGYIFSGHHHVNEIATSLSTYCPNFIELVLGSTHGQFWDVDETNNNAPITICPDGSPYGYAVVTFEGNKATNWYWKGVNSSRDFQMRLYKKNELYNANNTVSTLNGKVGANIFFWDETWKIDYYEDGVKKGTMARYSSKLYDPLAKFLLTNTKLKYHNSELTSPATDHMFYCTPSANATYFKLVVTDRWGRVYQDSSLIQ